MKATKLKIYVKTGKFSFPIPALRFSMLRWISKIIIKCCPSKMRAEWISQLGKPEIIESILKNMTYKNIDQIIHQLEQEEPFELVNVETQNKNKEKVIVKIYTL